LGFFFTFLTFDAVPLLLSSSSSPPTTFRLVIVGLDLEDSPGPEEEEEENERPFFSLASCFFASPGLESFALASPEANGSGSGGSPLA
jgi:hypothetical protein